MTELAMENTPRTQELWRRFAESIGLPVQPEAPKPDSVVKRVIKWTKGGRK